jgi:hypothetical protein
MYVYILGCVIRFVLCCCTKAGRKGSKVEEGRVKWATEQNDSSARF